MSAMVDTPELGRSATSFRSVPDMWHHRVDSTPDAPAFEFPRGGRWFTLTWAQAHQRVRAIANGLLALGLQPEDRVAIVAETCVEWVLADLAVLCAGAATTTAYPQSPDQDLAHILADSGARVVFTDTEAQGRRIAHLRGDLPDLAQVVVFDGCPDPDDDWLVSLERFERRGRDHGAAHPGAYPQAHRSVQPEQLATLMYTSGTTGPPRGVMLSHDAWVYEAEAVDALGLLTPADQQLLWLPLAHVFAKVLQLMQIRLGIPTVVDGRADRLGANLQEVQPTFVAAVPRAFEKMRQRIDLEVRRRGWMAWQLHRWALRVGGRYSKARHRGMVPWALRAEWAAADALVAARVRQQFGGRLRYFISGGAPLAASVGEYFAALGVRILEGYGLTESAAASCVNRPHDIRFGTVGPPLPGCSVRIADSGEILLRSRGLMTGYWNDEQATREAFTPDGYLRTGDLGFVLPSGHVKITGRLKDVLVTANGKNVAPARVERLLRTRSPLIEHVVMHGDDRPYCTSLITLDEAALARWARDRELPHAGHADLVTDMRVYQEIQRAVRSVNREVAAFERIRRFALLPGHLTVDNHLLTASGKVRRRTVEAHFQGVLDSLYSTGTTRPGPPEWSGAGARDTHPA